MQVAQRLVNQIRAKMQRLWERVHRSEVERLLLNDSLPTDRDPSWFRRLNIELSAPKLGQVAHRRPSKRYPHTDAVATARPPSSALPCAPDLVLPCGIRAQHDDIWPHVKGLSEYDGLATVVAALATHPEIFTLLFKPYKCPDTHTLVVGRDGLNHGIENGKDVSQLMHYLMAMAMGPGSGEWFGRLCDHERGGNHPSGILLRRNPSGAASGVRANDMLMIGDFGKDQDDEKALIMAVVMRRTGLIGALTVITNLGDNYMRARLAKGTLNALGAHDVRVAKGSDGGQADLEIHDYEFDKCPYLAPKSELDERGGLELFFTALDEARQAGRKISIVLNSALTDMAQAVRDPRWEALALEVVSHVVIMGG